LVCPTQKNLLEDMRAKKGGGSVKTKKRVRGGKEPYNSKQVEKNNPEFSKLPRREGGKKTFPILFFTKGEKPPQRKI